MAKAERDAMKAVEDEENAKVSGPPPDVKVLSKNESYSYTPPGPSHLPIETEVMHSPSEPKIPQSQVKMEHQTDCFPNPFSYLPSEPYLLPAKTENTSGMPLNPDTPSPSYVQQVHYAPNPSEVALQEIAKLQVKQTELSSLIAEQQRISSLPVQEPPTFGGSFFDYYLKQSLKVVCQQTRKVL